MGTRMTSHGVNPKRKLPLLRPLYLAVTVWPCCSRQGTMRAPEAANARSSPLNRAPPVNRSWPSFRSATNGSPSTTPRGGSCGRRCRAARRDARRPPDLQRHPESRGALLQPVSRWLHAAHAAHHLVGHRTPWRCPAGASGVPWLYPTAIRLRRTPVRRNCDGMRVIVAPTDLAPVELVHPLLFQPKLVSGSWPLPASQRRKRRRGKPPRHDSPRARPCGRPRGRRRRFERRKL